MRLRHREKLDVDLELGKVVGALLRHQLVLLVARVVLISEKKDSFMEALLFDRFELLVAGPQGLVQGLAL